MRPKRLLIDGINSFTTPQEIDFSFLSDSLFCVCGNTGSGKTTILDSMILALYGDCGRGGGLSGGAILSDYINLTREEAQVEFEFNMNGKDYTINRTFKRGKDGKAFLKENGSLISSQKTEINRIIEQVIGLNRADFTQVVVLEQGQFDKFLKRAGRERSSTVSNLFKLDAYKDLNSKVNVKISRVNAQIEASKKLISTYEHMNEQALNSINEQLNQLNEDNRLYSATLLVAEDNLNKLITKKKENERYLAIQAQLNELNIELNRLQNQLSYSLNQKRLSILNKLNQIEKNKLDNQTEIDNIEKCILDINAQIHQLNLRKQRATDYILSLYKSENFDLNDCKRDLESFKSLIEQKNKLSKRLKNVIDEQNENKSLFINLEEQIKKANENLELSNLELIKYHNLNAIKTVSNSLKSGDKCPICFNEITDIKFVENIDNYAQINFQNCQKEFNKINAEFSAINQKINSTDLVLEQLNMDILSNEQALIKTKINLNCTAEQLDLFFKAIESITQFLKSLEQLNNKLSSYNSQNQLLKSELNSLDTHFKAITDDLSDVNRLFDILYIKEDNSCYKPNEPVLDKHEIDQIYANYLQIQTQIKMLLNEQVKGEFNPKEFDQALIKYESIKQMHNQSLIKTGALTNEMQVIKKGIENKSQALKEYEQLNKQLIRLQTLFNLFKGEKFLEFICEEYVVSFTITASSILNKITLGRYSLHYERSEGKFYVCDYFFENKKRKVATLSGGETFLASLALSASISSHISRKNHEFFFLDEGFGTLDPDSISAVALALEELSKTSMVGLISHCTELTERISSKIIVSKADSFNGSSIQII